MIKMCQYFSAEEMEECCKDPSFCVVCLINRSDVKHDKYHVYEEYAKG